MTTFWSQMRAARMNRSWLARYPRIAPLLVFAFISAITIVSVIAIERSENARQSARLVGTAEVIAASLERRSATAGAYLRAGSALFETTGSVTPETFRRFAEELKLDGNFGGAEGIGWAPAVRAAQLSEWKEEAGRVLGRTIPVRPSLAEMPRDLIVPVFYLQPQTRRNARALGFDTYSEATRRAAIDEAIRLERPTASGPVVLQQERAGSAPGFLIYMPVFREGATRTLKGLIYCPFSAAEFLQAALPSDFEAGRYGVALYDAATPAAKLLAGSGLNSAEGQVASAQLTLANRPYRLEVSRAGQPMLSTLSMLTLLFGMAVAGLLLVLVRLMAEQARQDQQRLAWFEEQNSIRDSLTRELNHRVKNTIANVLSLVALTRRRSTDLDEFADSLDGRIRALAATHDLLTQSEWGTTPIGAVVAAELAPYAKGQDSVIDSCGPDVELAPNDALSLGMAVHELATNAAKYGALSQAGGRIAIRWTTVADDLAQLRWVESGGPPVPEQRSRGFGTDLIEKIVAHELRHPVDLQFHPDGVRCTIMVPIRRPSQFALRARAAQRELVPVD